MLKQVAIVLTLSLIICIYPIRALAQGESLSVASMYEIPGKVNDGDIVIVNATHGFAISKTNYHPSIFGVVSKNAAVIFSSEIPESTKSANLYPVSISGKTNVNVSTINGNIKKGDFITSSTKQGVGMKAARSGYVVGSALENYSGKSNGQIEIMINAHYENMSPSVGSSLLDVFQLTSIATYEQPLTVFKYFVALLIILLAFLIGFIIFGRIAGIGVEALGRNPLAHTKIQTGIIINTAITLGVIAAGLILAVVILKM
jgi:hypothetical protein